MSSPTVGAAFGARGRVAGAGRRAGPSPLRSEALAASVGGEASAAGDGAAAAPLLTGIAPVCSRIFWMRSAFLARDVNFTSSAEAIATNCSRSFASSTDCSRASAATGSCFPRNVPHGTEHCGSARRAKCESTTDAIGSANSNTRKIHTVTVPPANTAVAMSAGRIGKCGPGSGNTNHTQVSRCKATTLAICQRTATRSTKASTATRSLAT